MARKNHLSRLAAPKTWPLKRKGIKWVAKPLPSTHNLKYSLPLVVILRDHLKLGESKREIKRLLKMIEINGKTVRDVRFAVGLFDTIKIPTIDKYYRLVLNKYGKLNVIEIRKEEANVVLLRVTGKRMIPKGKLQLNFNNGWNLLYDKKDISVGDSAFFDVTKRKILKHIKLAKGKSVFIIGGKHTGSFANLQDFRETGLLKKTKIAILKTKKNEDWESPLAYVFPVGEKEPELKLN